jgi:hypothetical protein
MFRHKSAARSVVVDDAAGCQLNKQKEAER